jgi:hypothetical protein
MQNGHEIRLPMHPPNVTLSQNGFLTKRKEISPYQSFRATLTLMHRPGKATPRFAVIPLSEVPVTALPPEQKKSPVSKIAAHRGRPRNRSEILHGTPSKRGTRR